MRKLDHDTRCETLIVGAGYTGLAAARRLHELSPETDTILIDASEAGEGNPGRNSGFLLEIALAQDADPGAVQRMRDINALLQDTMHSLVRAVAKHGIHCDLQHTGTYRAAAGRAGLRNLHRYRAFLEATGLPCERLDRQALAARLGTWHYAEGLYSPHCWLVQPAALARGLTDALPAPVSHFEHTPALGLQRDGRSWLVATPGGNIRAQQVLLANNAFVTTLGIARSHIAKIYTYAGLTAPLAADDPGGSEPAWGLLPAHRLGSTLRRTPDNRLLVRSLYAYERELPPTRVGSALHAALTRRFPALAATQFEHVWGGATGFTRAAAPVWGEIKSGLWVSAGCNGGGIVKGTLFGRLIAERMLGGQTADIPALFGRPLRMPPEPFRRLGFHAVAAFERLRGRAEV